MKVNPKIAKSPKDLVGLEFKTMKALIRKELKRLEHLSSAEHPTPLILLGEHDYPDKPAMALPIFGKWKGEFKQYAKKEVALLHPMGAIGAAYIDAENLEGKKVVHLLLSKGKGKNKLSKLERNLYKLIPNSSYTIVFGELSELELEALEQRMETSTEAESFEEDEVPNVPEYLSNNFKEIAQLGITVKAELVPKIKANSIPEDALDQLVELDDLIYDWTNTFEAKTTAEEKLSFGKHQEVVASAAATTSKLLNRVYRPEETASFFNTALKNNLPPKLDIPPIQAVPFVAQVGKTDCLNAAASMIELYLKSIGAEGMAVQYKNGAYKSTGILALEQKDLRGKVYEPRDTEKAIAYINACLAKQLPVLVGVSLINFNGLDSGGPGLAGAKGDGRYNDGTTDHFITIVGSFNNGGEPGYYYLDPGNASSGKDLNANQLVRIKDANYSFAWQDPQSGIFSGKAYVLSRVLQYELPLDCFNPQDKENPIQAELQSTVSLQSKGKDARLVQYFLNKNGAKLKVDGDCGPATKAAIEAFQQQKGIRPVDGVVAPNSPTWLALTGKKAIEPIRPEEVQFQYLGTAKKMPANTEAVLRKLLAQIGEKQVSIVNTLRTEEEQAAVIYANLKAFGIQANRRQYRNPAAASEVLTAYEELWNKGIQSEAVLKEAVLKALKKVGAANLSGHCNLSNPAIDILPASIQNKAAFEKAFKSNPMVAKLVCPPKDTSYHIELKL